MCDIKAREKSATNLAETLTRWVAKSKEKENPAVTCYFYRGISYARRERKWRRRGMANHAGWWPEPLEGRSPEISRRVYTGNSLPVSPRVDVHRGSFRANARAREKESVPVYARETGGDNTVFAGICTRAGPVDRYFRIVMPPRILPFWPSRSTPVSPPRARDEAAYPWETTYPHARDPARRAATLCARARVNRCYAPRAGVIRIRETTCLPPAIIRRPRKFPLRDARSINLYPVRHSPSVFYIYIFFSFPIFEMDPATSGRRNSTSQSKTAVNTVDVRSFNSVYSFGHEKQPSSFLFLLRRCSVLINSISFSFQFQIKIKSQDCIR